jgi:hypothetical protein
VLVFDRAFQSSPLPRVPTRQQWQQRCRIWADSQETEAEDAEETHLLGDGEPQGVEHRQRQDEDGNIGRDVPRGMDVPLGGVGDARGFDAHVPGARYGSALEDDEAQLQRAPHPDDC